MAYDARAAFSRIDTCGALVRTYVACLIIVISKANQTSLTLILKAITDVPITYWLYLLRQEDSHHKNYNPKFKYHMIIL